MENPLLDYSALRVSPDGKDRLHFSFGTQITSKCLPDWPVRIDRKMSRVVDYRKLEKEKENWQGASSRIT